MQSDGCLYWFTWVPRIPGTEIYGSFHGAFEMYVFGDLEAYNAVPTEADAADGGYAGRNLGQVCANRQPQWRTTARLAGVYQPTWNSDQPSVPARTCAYRSLS